MSGDCPSSKNQQPLTSSSLQACTPCDMMSHRKFREEPECYPMQIYFLEGASTELLKSAKTFDLPIILPESNNNNEVSKLITKAIYVLIEFEDSKMLSRVEETPDTWILGPTALEEMSQNPNLELRSKPTYCTFMYPFVFYINCPGDFPLMTRLVKLLKWMGGRFVDEPNQHMTHMITTHTLAKGYLYCYTFKVPILSPGWVEYCWKHRSIAKFDVTSVMNIYGIGAFLGLKLAFKGTCSENVEQMEGRAISRGALVVQPNNPLCTHLVVSLDTANYLNITDIPTHIQYIVNEGWFWSSVEESHRVCEDDYLCIKPHEIRTSLWATMDDAEKESRKNKNNEFTLRKFSNSHEEKLFETAKIETQNMKRKYAFEELYLHEKSFVHFLKMLCTIQELATDIHQAGGFILNQSEANKIFGNSTKLMKYHQELLDYFEDTIITWHNKAKTVHQLLMCKGELLKQYAFYITNYKENQKHMEEFESKSIRFQKLLGRFRNAKTKENLKDIFSHPIQRLCRFVTQLQEISRNTREDNPDKDDLREAIKIVKSVLSKTYYPPKHIENFKNIRDIHHRIQDCPDYLISYYRQFIYQFSAWEVVRCLEGYEAGIKVTFFLFNDILEIATVRTKYFESQRPYLHIATLPLSMIVNVIEFEGINEGDKKVFGINIQNIEEEGTTSIHCFQYYNEDRNQLKDILLMIAKLLAQRDSSKSLKEFIRFDIPITRISMFPITEKDSLVDCWDISKMSSENNQRTNMNTSLRRSLSCGNLFDHSNVDVL